MARNPLVEFGKRVRAIRKAAGFSQEALADYADIDRSYLGAIERGEVNLTLIKIHQIAKALRISPKEFFS
ncbi:MAG: helix-turn-helix transcriptional regulator [Spongiibacteraceae bacterium]